VTILKNRFSVIHKLSTGSWFGSWLDKLEKIF